MKTGDKITCIDPIGVTHLTKGKDYICLWANQYEVSVRNDIQRETSYDVDRFTLSSTLVPREPLDRLAETLYTANVAGTNEEGIKWTRVHAQVKRRYREMARAVIALYGTVPN